MMVVTDILKCSCCHRLLPVAEFAPRRDRPRGYAYRCKHCCAAAMRARYHTDAGKVVLRRYRQSARGRAVLAGYVASHAGKLAHRRAVRKYQRTPRGRQVSQRAMHAYHRTAKYRALVARASHARRIREAGAPNDLTDRDWAQLLADQNYACAYCGRPFSHICPPTRDHVMPLSHGGGLTKNNVLPACQSCNSSKGNRPVAV